VAKVKASKKIQKALKQIGEVDGNSVRLTKNGHAMAYFADGTIQNVSIHTGAEAQVFSKLKKMAAKNGIIL
jgi:hypothetical protein